MKHLLWLDKVGWCTSAFCAIHCAAAPLLYLFGASGVVLFIQHEWMEMTILSVTLLVGISSLVPAWWVHRRWYVPALFLLGLALVMLGERLPEQYSLPVAVAGASLLALSHLFNWKIARHAVH